MRTIELFLAFTNLWVGSLSSPYGPLLESTFAVPGNATYDYIVVGGGTAGLAIASRLAEQSRYSVAVVEAGSFYEIGNSNNSEIPAYVAKFTGPTAESINPFIDWGFSTTNQLGLGNRSLHYTQGKNLGGGSGRNYLFYHRGTASFYRNWADIVGDDSYTWDNMLPFFKKSTRFTPPSTSRPANSTPKYDQDVLGDEGPVSITYAPYAWPFSSHVQQAFLQAGIPLAKGALQDGVLNGFAYVTSTMDAATAVRESSETSYLRKIGFKASRLAIYVSTLATKILFDGQKAVGVNIEIAGYNYTLSATREIILSAGTYQSPHLLMVSGIGPAAILNKFDIPIVSNLSGVGQNMQDHTLGGPSYKVTVPTAQLFADPKFAAIATERYVQNRTGPLSAFAVDMLAYEKIPEPLRSNFSSATSTALGLLPADWPEIEIFVQSAYWGNGADVLPISDGNVASILVSLTAPFSRGTVSISSSSMHDAPIIDPGWLTSPIDKEVVVAAFRRARQIFETSALQAIMPLPRQEISPGPDKQTDEQILEAIGDTFAPVLHACCTNAMGRSAETGAVVDSRARVFGVRGLRVVDHSVMPQLVQGHPTATIYGLGEKIAADILSADTAT